MEWFSNLSLDKIFNKESRDRSRNASPITVKYNNETQELMSSEIEELVRTHLGHIDEKNQIILKELDKQGEVLEDSKSTVSSDIYPLTNSHKILSSMLSNIGYYLKYLNPFYLLNSKKSTKDDYTYKKKNKTNLNNDSNINNTSDDEICYRYDTNDYYDIKKTSNDNICIMDIICHIKDDSLKINDTLDNQLDDIDEMSSHTYRNTDILENNNKLINKLLR